ncbi:MAG TPA: PAS domain S-box protein [Vicinamibacterales bacterium]
MSSRPMQAVVTKPNRRARRAAVNYALSFLGLVAAVLLRYALDQWMGNTLPLVTLFGAVAGAAWIGGYGPASVVAVLGYVVCEFLFIEPRYTFAFDHPRDQVGLAAYLFTCVLIIIFGEGARRAKWRAREQRDVLRVTLHSIGDGVITTDINGCVTYMNALAESLTGWKLEKAVGQSLDTVFRIVNEETREAVENLATRALREGVPVGPVSHTVLIQNGGREFPIDDRAAPIRDELGSVSGCVLIFREISAQRQMERDKAEQLVAARFLGAIVESSDDAIISKSLEGIIQSWNAAAERMFGHTAEQAIGRHISLVIPPERIQEEDRIIASLKAGQRIDHFETVRVRADARPIDVSLTISPIKDPTGAVVGASKIARDITERKRAEEERENFVRLIENSSDFIGMCNLEGIPFFINRAGLDLVGLDDVDSARRAPLASFFFPEDQDRIIHEFLPSVLSSGSGEIEVRFRNFKTGEARWMAYKVLTLPDADGRPIGFATVSQDVTERKRLNDDLHRLAIDLAAADRRKNEFLALLAHELRNPLAPISNTVRALRRGVIDKETVRSASELLQRQVGQMSRLVDDLLDMSRISSGKIELRKDRIELAPVVAQAVEAARPQFRKLNHELTVALPPQPVYVNADRARLTQVIANLLNNAAKYTDAGGRVWLTMEHQGSEAVIRVRDTGIGIAAGQLPRVFDMFAQADTSLERSRDGLGIGLTLVKTFVELHGGTVEARSAGLGRGSEFIIRLPVLVAGAEIAPPSPANEASPVASRRVLVVDDSEDGAESMAMILQFAGHETVKAYDGVAAIEAAERFRPDVVLLDIGLPRMNGYEVCRRLRQEPWGRDITIVALTGWGQEDDRTRSKEAGFDVHMVKPVDFDALLQLLASAPSRTAPQARGTR